MMVVPMLPAPASVEKRIRHAETSRLIAAQRKKQFVFILNYEAAWRPPACQWIPDVKFDLIINDESHRIKDPTGKTSKFFSNVSTDCPRKLQLTGTPMPHSPLDIFGQYRFVDPGIFGQWYGGFRSAYAEMGGYEDRQVLRYKNLDDLHNRMYRIAYRVKSEDVFDLPDQIDEISYVDFSPQERKYYEEMNKTFMIELESGVVTAQNALVKMLRLQELTSGFIEGMPIGTSKTNALAETLEDIDSKEPVVVFCRFTNDLIRTREVVEK
jgi:SNF2 family DNA or RNA helicase